MSLEEISFFPNKISKNTLAMITFNGKLTHIGDLILEYSFIGFTENPYSIQKANMTINGDSAFVFINIENSNSLYFRFADKFGVINDHYGTPYRVDIYDDAPEKYTDAFSLINAYNQAILTKSESTTTTNYSNYTSQETSYDFKEVDDSIDEDPYQTYSTQNEYSSSSENLSLVPLKNRDLMYARKGLRLSYRINKRIRLILIKLFRSLPSFITGNYRRRLNL